MKALSDNKQTTINLITSLAAFVINAGISFVLTPYILEKLGNEAYGFIGLAYDFVNYAGILTLALNSMSCRFVSYEYHRGNKEKADIYVNSILGANLILAGAITLCAVFMVWKLEYILTIPKALMFDVKLTFAIVFINYIFGICFSVFNSGTFVKNRMDLYYLRNLFSYVLKLVLTILYIVLLFAASNPLGLTLSLIFLAVMYAVAKIPFKLILKSLKPIFPIIVFTAVLNLFFVSGEGDPVFKLGFLTVYAEGIRYAVLMAVRVMALIAGTSLLTYTTSPIVLTDAIEQLLKPLGRLHFPVHELAMMMSIALRFIPTLIEETDKIMNAQKARGAQLDNGKMTERIKALVPVLVPLFISAFRRADELAMAMECRCYRGGDGRTRLKVLRCEKQDYIDLAVCIACFAVIFASRLVFPNF